MSMSRRKAIAILGGGLILAAGGTTAGFLSTRRPDKALAPWDRAGDYTEIRQFALSYAVLAPNPHNLQPWLVDLSQADTVILHRDMDRDLPHTDPYSRQLTIGLGCFLELMRIAAAWKGFGVEMDLYPEGENGPVAIARFSEGAAKDMLFEQILKRRSCKEPFEDRMPEPQRLAGLEKLARLVTEDAEVARVKQLTIDSWMVELETPHTYKESVDLMRLGKTEINANPDGIDLGGPFLESLMAAGMLTRESLLEVGSSSYNEGIKMYHTLLSATPAFAVVTTPGNSRLDQIEAGRRWVRLNLETTARGLALHPVSQALQEYPEMREHYESAHNMLAKPGHTVQMLGRLGFGPTLDYTPRWPLESRIVNG